MFRDQKTFLLGTGMGSGIIEAKPIISVFFNHIIRA